MILQELLFNYDILNDELNIIINETDDPICQAKSAQIIISRAIEKNHTKILEKGFQSEQDEIMFFKTIYPLFLAQQIYFYCLYNFETQKPVCSDKVLKKYCKKKLAELNRFFKTHKEFYEYYRSKSSCSDQLFFTRNEFDTLENFCNLDFTIDNRFSTKHTHLIARIISNDRLRKYIQSVLNSHINTIQTPVQETMLKNKNIKLFWTGSKAALAEVLFALIGLNVFNNGNVSNKLVFEEFGILLNIDLEQHPRMRADIKCRKIEKPIFVNKMQGVINNLE